MFRFLGLKEALLNCPIVDANTDRVLSESSCKPISPNPGFGFIFRVENA